MTAATVAAIDLGPLAWVRPEIDQALARAMGAVARFFADPSDEGSIATSSSPSSSSSRTYTRSSREVGRFLPT